MQVTCSKCGTPFPGEWGLCPTCGTPLPQANGAAPTEPLRQPEGADPTEAVTPPGMASQPEGAAPTEPLRQPEGADPTEAVTPPGMASQPEGAVPPTAPLDPQRETPGANTMQPTEAFGASAAGQENPFPSTPVAPAPQPFYPGNPAPATPPTPPKKSKTGLIVGIIGGVVGLALIVVAVLFFTGVFGGKSKDAKKTDENPPVPTEETTVTTTADTEETEETEDETEDEGFVFSGTYYPTVDKNDSAYRRRVIKAMKNMLGSTIEDSEVVEAILTDDVLFSYADVCLRCYQIKFSGDTATMGFDVDDAVEEMKDLFSDAFRNLDKETYAKILGLTEEEFDAMLEQEGLSWDEFIDYIVILFETGFDDGFEGARDTLDTLMNVLSKLKFTYDVDGDELTLTSKEGSAVITFTLKKLSSGYKITDVSSTAGSEYDFFVSLMDGAILKKK